MAWPTKAEWEDIESNPSNYIGVVEQSAEKDRNKNITIARLRGETFVSIGARFNLTPSRVREVYIGTMRKSVAQDKKRKNGVPIFDTLSVRSRHALFNAGARNDDDVREMFDRLGVEGMSKINNFGRKSMREVAEAYGFKLEQNGVTREQYKRALRIVRAYEEQNKPKT